MGKIYCVFCGTENDSKEDKCKNPKCKRKLNPKSHLFRNYVIDKFKGDIDDSIFEIIFKFIKNNLYGVILSASVVATVTTVVINTINNNYVEELTEEPKFASIVNSYEYLGEGLSRSEVIDKYLSYVKNGDIKSANGLIAENFLTKEELDLIPFNKAEEKYYNKIKHDFIISNDKFFSDLSNNDGIKVHKDDGLGRFARLFYEEKELTNNSKINIVSHYIELTYCLSNNCNDEGILPLMEVLETIEVNGKTYILSEYAFLTDNYSRVVRYLFDEYNGDLSSLTNKKFYEVMDSCIDEYGKVTCNLKLPEFGEE